MFTNLSDCDWKDRKGKEITMEGVKKLLRL
jgi:hypothetical protein